LVSKKVLKEKLVANKEMALMSRRLAEIKRDAPLEISLEEIKFSGFNREILKKYFEELGFKSLVERV